MYYDWNCLGLMNVAFCLSGDDSISRVLFSVKLIAASLSIEIGLELIASAAALAVAARS